MLLSDYLSQVHKWIKCLQIIETRYCLRKVREELKEMKFEKYEVTQWRINEEEWRVLVDGKSKNEKDLKDSKELEYLLMNKVSLKIAGHKYDLKDLQGESEV